jgi:hypothetical protein
VGTLRLSARCGIGEALSAIEAEPVPITDVRLADEAGEVSV